MKNNLFVIVSFLLFLSGMIMGCASTSTLTTIEPPLECGDCAESSTSFSESWGPVALNGGINMDNIVALTAWWTAINKAGSAASEELAKKVDAYQCDDGCSKEIVSTSTMTVETNPGGTQPSANCDHTVTKQIKVSGSSINCALAQAAMTLEAMSTANNLDDVCNQYGSECVVKSVDIDMDSIQTSENESSDGLFGSCQVTGEATATIKCAEDSGEGGGIDSPIASGTITADIKCTAPQVCSDNGGMSTVCQDSRDGTRTAICVVDGLAVEVECDDLQEQVSCLTISSSQMTTVDDGARVGKGLTGSMQLLGVIE